MKRIVCCILFLISFPEFAISQNNNWEIELPHGTILGDLTLQSLQNDSLFFSREGKSRALPLSSIEGIARGGNSSKATRGLLTGILIGGSAGFLLGLILDHENSPTYISGFTITNKSNSSSDKLVYAGVGAASTGILGLAIASSSKSFSYDMRDMSIESKRRVVESILNIDQERLPATQSKRDVVYLKNGSVIKGTVLEMIPDSTVKIQTADSSLFVFKMTEVERVTKEISSPSSSIPSPNGGVSSGLSDDGKAQAKFRKFFFGVNGGVGIPVGEFGDPQIGWATPDIAFRGDLGIDVGPNASWMLSLTYTHNATSFPPVSVPGHVVSGESGSWTIVWLMTGLRPYGEIAPSTYLYGVGQAGLLFGSTPEITVTVDGLRSIQPSSTGTAFAFSVGFGAIINNKFSFDGRYLHSKPEYNVVASGGGYTVSGKVQQPTAMIVISLGYIF